MTIPPNLHPIERCIADALRAGRELTLSEIGGFDAILAAESKMENSRFLPEILSLIIDGSIHPLADDQRSFVARAVNRANLGPLVQSCMRIIDANFSAFDENARLFFQTFSTRSNDLALDGVTRTAFLEGAVRMAIRESSLQYGLIDLFLNFEISGLDHAKHRFVKMLGICHGHWGRDETKQKLRELCEDADVVAEANLEIGLHHFGQFLNTDDPSAVKVHIREAESRFRTAGEHATVQAEATLYRLACRMVRDFSEGELSTTAGQISNELDRSLVALHAYHRTNLDPDWLGSRTSELFHWQGLIHRLRYVDSELDRAAWFEPAQLIVSSLIPIYKASRSLLARDQLGGVEVLIQPRIVGSIAQNCGHVENLKRWLERNPTHELAAEVTSLLTTIKQRIEPPESPGLVWGRASRNQTFTIYRDGESESEIISILHQIYADAAGLHLRHLNAIHEQVILQCVEAVQNHPDYQIADVRRLFNATLLWMVRYMDSRLNLTNRDEPHVSFLFRKEGGKRALENDLQRDFVSTLSPFMLGTEIEVENIGSGRADVFLRCNAEKLACEVKRDHKDCSFEKLMEKYSDQTVQYQNSSSRISFMLVLDQTNRGGRALHLSDSIRPMLLELDGEQEPRHVIVCLVSGDRLRPSDLSRQSRAKRLQ